MYSVKSYEIPPSVAIFTRKNPRLTNICQEGTNLEVVATDGLGPTNSRDLLPEVFHRRHFHLKNQRKKKQNAQSVTKTTKTANAKAIEQTHKHTKITEIVTHLLEISMRSFS